VPSDYRNARETDRGYRVGTLVAKCKAHTSESASLCAHSPNGEGHCDIGMRFAFCKSCAIGSAGVVRCPDGNRVSGRKPAENARRSRACENGIFDDEHDLCEAVRDEARRAVSTRKPVSVRTPAARSCPSRADEGHDSRCREGRGPPSIRKIYHGLWYLRLDIPRVVVGSTVASGTRLAVLKGRAERRPAIEEDIMTTKQETSGKGKSRVEIAEEARDRAKGKLDLCEERLAKAIKDEKGRAKGKKEKEKKKKERAREALRKIGWTEDRIAKEVG